MAKDDKECSNEKPLRAEWTKPRLIVVNLEDAEGVNPHPSADFTIYS